VDGRSASDEQGPTPSRARSRSAALKSRGRLIRIQHGRRRAVEHFRARRKRTASGQDHAEGIAPRHRGWSARDRGEHGARSDEDRVALGAQDVDGGAPLRDRSPSASGLKPPRPCRQATARFSITQGRSRRSAREKPAVQRLGVRRELRQTVDADARATQQSRAAAGDLRIRIERGEDDAAGRPQPPKLGRRRESFCRRTARRAPASRRQWSPFAGAGFGECEGLGVEAAEAGVRSFADHAFQFDENAADARVRTGCVGMDAARQLSRSAHEQGIL